MIQEIAPRHLDNQYSHKPVRVSDEARVCIFNGRDILITRNGEDVVLPTVKQLGADAAGLTYLFSVGDEAYYLAEFTGEVIPGFAFENLRTLRTCSPQYTMYACMTAWHLHVWYRDNTFCGRCGTKTVHDGNMRMKFCPHCGNQIFPKICPAVIVGVTHGDKILLTRYAGRSYKNYALIAGFTEIGETAEETVQREVLEEAGVHVKNIRYWDTQPWGIDTDLLIGYFAELDGDDSITLDRDELSMAGWYTREEIDMEPDRVSLTHDMIRAFMEDRHKSPRKG